MTDPHPLPQSQNDTPQRSRLLARMRHPRPGHITPDQVAALQAKAERDRLAALKDRFVANRAKSPAQASALGEKFLAAGKAAAAGDAALAKQAIDELEALMAIVDAALPPSSAVAAALQRLAEEEAAFEKHKTKRKADKIMASESNKAKPKEDKPKEDKPSLGDKVRDKLSFGKKKDKDTQDANPTKDPVDRIDQALDNKKADDELKKVDPVFKGAGAAGVLDAALAKGVGATLDAGNQGDDIASAAGLLTASTAALASSMNDGWRAYKLWSKTEGAARAQHAEEMSQALGAFAGNLLNMGKASATVAKHANAAEAASAVPILGIVAAVPELIVELNQLRTAVERLARQEKIHAQFEKAIQGGDTSQATLYTVVSSFIEQDAEAIGKGIARVALDATKIAGHGVTLGGITGPIGVALVGIGSAGKLVISAADGAKDLVDAHGANHRRKKLQPTLHALRDLKDLVKGKPSDPAAQALIAALEALAQVEKGTPAHAAALDKLTASAEAFKNAHRHSTEAVAYADTLAGQAAQEKASWAAGGDADQADPLAQKKGGTLSPLEAQHRDARKLMGKDPRLAAQTLLDQALREGGPGGPAFAVLKTFGIEESQVYGGAKDGDERLALNREMRQKILFELASDDETAKTLTQAMGEAKDSVKGYFSVRSKHAELADYMEAKNLLQVKGKSKRGKVWHIKMDLLTDDIEEKKETLLGYVEHLVAEDDIDPALAAQVRQLLAPRKDKASA